VSRQDEKSWCGQLTELAQGIGTIDRSQPVLIGIGQAFAIIDERANRKTTDGALLLTSRG
jgi:hypothetical protein